ncbi:MAG TPA: putative porin [Opitutaceae bacterium]|nr:putative porin [Opitutaceae bacterium]
MLSLLTIAKRASLAGFLATSLASFSYAQDSGPLIDLLVRKGILDDQEAEELRTELIKEFTANSSAGKMNLSSSLTELKLSGDIRLRHQVETQAAQNGTTTTERTRERFRFRFNGDALLQKGWGAGFAFETASAADSGNQTFQDGGNDYALYLARAYLSWQPNQNWLFVGGKQRNPLYATDLTWDADINPQGASEIYKHFFDGKDTLEFRALQSIMDDRPESTSGPAGRDAWMFAQQLVYTKWFGKDEIGNQVNSLILAPGFLTYNQSTLDGLDNETPFNGTTRGLSLLTFAGEANWANVAGPGTQFKLYWDSSYNLEAARRVRQAYGLTGAEKDALAWLVGVGYAYGAGKVQGDYSVKLDYRQIGIGSVDPNITDSDFAFGNLNQEGFKLAGSYNVTDFANFNVTYFYTTDKRETLLQSAVAKLDHSQTLQVDLVVKF